MRHWLLGAALAASAPVSAQHSLAVGSLELTRCAGALAYCGDLERPLDPSGALGDRISIHFEFYRHRGPGTARGTLVATEGGPGYPATLSRDDYLSLFGPLLQDRDFILMDNRGTGKSGAIECHALQSAPSWTVALIGACGMSLGPRASLYSTAYAADDLAAILDALKVDRIDLYGDSYGTYFEQVFVLRHPERLRSVLLDGAYPLDGPDYAWYPAYAGAVREKFDRACERSPACARLPGSSIARLRTLLDALRAQPFTAAARDSDGKEVVFEANASKLAIVMFGSAPPLSTLRELDAAARAFAAGDRVPLLRLMAETTSAVDSRDPTADPAKWSAGLAAAVMCQDPPQLFDLGLPPPRRREQFERLIAERGLEHPDTYGPFTISEYRGMPLDYGFIEQCLEWPAPPAAHPAARVVPADARYPDIPALVLSGEFDTVTTMADGAAVAAKFERGRQVMFANSFHVNALPRSRSDCGSILARRFFETLSAGDTACAAAILPIRLVPQFAPQASDLAPLKPAQGNASDAAALRLAAAALLTAGDVLTRVPANSTGHGAGLRGGHFDIKTGARRIRVRLHQVRFTEDLAVDGRIERPSGREGAVAVDFQLHTPRRRGRLFIRWFESPNAAPVAEVTGAIDGKAVRAQAPAP